MSGEPVRLQKLLSQAGVASRRKAEELMQAGRVAVNGDVVTQMGVKVDPQTDVVHVDGLRLPPVSAHAYLALNKPSGVVSTMEDPQGRRCLADLLAGRDERLFHVGRLDTETDGLILLTNHGEFAHRMAHPSYEISKTYVAQVRGAVKPGLGRVLAAGIELDDGPVRVDRFKILEARAEKSIVELDLHVGRNRIVRRMLAAAGHPVEQLTRTAVGSVRLEGLRSGSIRELSRDELGRLLDSVAL